MIKIQNVSKKYQMGEEIIMALDEVSLEIKKGEFVAIVGPSGSGKSTLMHLIGALDYPDNGTVVIDGYEVSDKKNKDNDMAKFRSSKIGFVFQTFNLEPTLTAVENVQLPLTIAGVNGKDSLALARLAMKKVDLSERQNHRPSELSGGQRQRVAIARSIVNEPKVLLADEPTGNLDSKTGAKIIRLLKNFSRKDKTTVIVVTHDEELASGADRVIRLKDGKIVK